MSEQLRFVDWLKLRFPRGCPTSFDMTDLDMAFRAGKSIGATQPQAPQGAVTPKVSVFQYARCNNTLCLMAKPYPRTCAECGLGPCKTRSGAAPETPEGQKP